MNTNPRELLLEPVAYMPPARAIPTGICPLVHSTPSGDIPAGVTSVAEIIAHLSFWQEWFIRRCLSTGEPMPSSAAQQDGRRSHRAPGYRSDTSLSTACIALSISWRRVRQRSDRPVVPAIEFPPLGTDTVRDVLTHIAYHNSHHLGQVITLRQMIGAWPPPSGSYTW